MKPFTLAGTATAPTVTLDAKTGTFEISGRSVMDNGAALYANVLAWLKEYAQNPNPQTVFTFRFEYFNTESERSVLDILSVLASINNAKASWHYPQNDADMREAGEGLFDLVNIPFEFKTY